MSGNTSFVVRYSLDGGTGVLWRVPGVEVVTHGVKLYFKPPCL